MIFNLYTTPHNVQQLLHRKHTTFPFLYHNFSIMEVSLYKQHSMYTLSHLSNNIHRIMIFNLYTTPHNVQLMVLLRLYLYMLILLLTTLCNMHLMKIHRYYIIILPIILFPLYLSIIHLININHLKWPLITVITHIGIRKACPHNLHTWRHNHINNTKNPPKTKNVLTNPLKNNHPPYLKNSDLPNPIHGLSPLSLTTFSNSAKIKMDQDSSNNN